MAVRNASAPGHVGRTAKKVGDAAKKGELVNLRSGQRHRRGKSRVKAKKPATSFSEFVDATERMEKMRGQDVWRLGAIKEAKILVLRSSAERVSGCMGSQVRTGRFPRLFRYKPGLKFDYVIVIAGPQYDRASEDEKTQIVYHALRHAERHTNGTFYLAPHDHEGFIGEVEFFGLRSQETKRIAEQLQLAGITG